MALVVGTNSYNDVSGADLYFTDRLNSENWDSHSDKESVLITATLIQDSLCVWDGSKTDEDQNLEFPRDGETEVPNDIKIANLEIALEISNQDVTSFTSPVQDLSKLKAGSVTLDFLNPNNSVSLIVNSVAQAKLSKYGRCNFGTNSIRSVPLFR